ncbi:C-GCAxxG-C-C family protein [Flagellimonas okinawensis]|uniref:C-GCAxxG-C-C family protein n=1 Tax=Flagellimonas okinawensis TaxID=3031324 RepID=A0ABT5XTF1_9FLAO|nr:C-GCAxxG-C-C family protein [[Muricauda] okinawensis]MDF0709162.1 C-GCAxxG-C-C family protein [[Muricauda] okinawensis]
MDKSENKVHNGPDDGKKIFRKKRTCSRTFFYLLNREFGHLKEPEERASDSLAGGILQEGHQCGMLWGASLAVGAEAYRRYHHSSLAIAVAVRATQEIMASFRKREKTMDCREITQCDFSNKLSMAKYMITGRFLHCFQLAQDWAPEAVRSAHEGLNTASRPQTTNCVSCASETAKKMGATDEESIMVAGFAGGLGLSGGGCGALAAAIWLKSLRWCREIPKKSSMDNPYAMDTLNVFQGHTNKKMRCSEISGTHFKNLEEHSRFLDSGGCAELIHMLTETKITNF